MLGRTRFRRTTLGLVALLVAPALVLGLPHVAQAAILYSDAVSWEGSEGSQAIGGLQCSGSARWRADTSSTLNPKIIGNTRCKLWGPVSVTMLVGSGSTQTTTFTGDRFGVGGGVPGPGTVCAFSETEGVVEGSGGEFQLPLSVDGAYGCVLTKVCIEVKAVANNWPDQEFELCRAIALEEAPVEEPEPPTTCNQGTITAPTEADSDGEGTTGYPLFAPISRYRFTLDPGTGYVAGQGFNTYVYLSNGYVSGGSPVNGNNSGWFTTSAGLSDSDGDGPQFYGPEVTIIGFGVYATGAAYGNPPVGLPQNVTNGRIGVSNPAVCSFYWGEKVANVVDSDVDEPVGPMPGGSTGDPTTDAPPLEEPEPDSCGFDFTDPGTWATGSLCAMTGLLGELLNLIKRLISAVGRIAGAILDGIEWLFVPNVDSWDWDGFVDQAESRPPASVVADMGETAKGVGTGFSGAGDCGILADFGDGMEISCADARNVPGYSVLYGLVQVGLVALTGLGMFKMVRSSMGGNGQ